MKEYAAFRKKSGKYEGADVITARLASLPSELDQCEHTRISTYNSTQCLWLLDPHCNDPVLAREENKFRHNASSGPRGVLEQKATELLEVTCVSRCN